ncbi:MetS family NSS transporter small subunit [Methanooceanicella nereidis]|nr:MetS family NSS transporter small subunit [Methanocella sp. CWC-04]
MELSAILMFLFGATVLWGGSAYFLYKTMTSKD